MKKHCTSKLFSKLYFSKLKGTKPKILATKHSFITTKLLGPRDKINDGGIRAVLVPLFGIGIPLITRLVPPNQFTNWEIKLSYLYTIAIAFVIYEGTRFLYLTLRAYFDWFNKPIRKLLAIVLSIPFYVVPASTLMLVGWYKIFMKGVVDWDTLKLTTLIILIAVYFLVNLYETVFLVRDVANEKVKKEQLERARAEAELEALKNQVDPHFIFNSLNTLSHLIEEKPEKAQAFNTSLADVYRYILHNKARDLVFIKDELDFIQNYFSLLKIRFDQAVQMEVDIPADWPGRYLLPPISLQTLVENAVKHNEFNDQDPLVIRILAKDQTLVITNKIRQKKTSRPGSRIGLENLRERYRLITDREIEIINDEHSFTVILPLTE